MSAPGRVRNTASLGGISPRVERALRWAAVLHAGQTRKASEIPYFAHVAAVAMIVEHAGFGEDAVIAALLHDTVEDTDATLKDVEDRFGPAVAATVAACSEIKRDAEGRPRPWIDRKRDHLHAMSGLDLTARAVILADKLHNLVSIELDLDEGRPVWKAFNAGRDQVLWYYRAVIDACDDEADPRVHGLAQAARAALERIEARGPNLTTSP
ncbi:MAG: HD domain-containing protein [Isosphaeraceae bacterium]